jgi:hypothetical protein
MVLVAFGSKSSVGKDAAVEIIIEALGSKKATRISFGDEVKEIARNLFGFNMDQLWGKLKNVYDGNPTGMSPRQVLQKLAQLIRDTFYADVWIDKAFRKIDSAMLSKVEWFLIPDLRYKNEARRIKERGGILVRINRVDLLPIENPTHISEVDLDDWKEWDYVIENNGSLEDFKVQVLALVEKINKPAPKTKVKTSDLIDHYYDDFTVVS